MATILAVDDEQPILELIKNGLQKDGHMVTGYVSAEQVPLNSLNRYDLIILDIMMPGMDGFSFCEKIRSIVDCPILFLTAKTMENDITFGLGLGADDYLTKPFAIEELLARMRVAFKHAHAGGAKKVILEVQGLEIDTDKRMVTVNGTVVDLTKKEYELLLYLVQNKNIVLSREQILNEVWGYSYIGETNVVDVYIRYLRSKIDEAFGIKYIHTIRGVGYYVKDE